MTSTRTGSEPDQLVEHTQTWLDALASAVADRDPARVGALFADHGSWRDLVALTEDVHTYCGPAQIEDGMAATLPTSGFAGIEIQEHAEFPRIASYGGTETVEALFRFSSRLGSGRGVVTLVPSDAGPRAQSMLTALDELAGHPERLGEHRPTGTDFARTFYGPNWLELREQRRRYTDREPTVVVVGAGQSGLSVAARLTHLGVDTLVVERNKRVGDNWRLRYRSLTLHNEVWGNHLPYLPFPDSWPIYLPKDKLANWLESYAEAMELDCWTGTALVSGSYDDAAGTWTLHLDQGGRERVLRPRHLVLTTGVSSAPIRPRLPGLEQFRGSVLHTADLDGGEPFRDRRVLVVGSGTSGHDAAHELHEHGAQVTIAQRGATTVVTAGPEHAGRFYSAFNQGRALADTDLLFASVPFPVLRRNHQLLARDFAELDRELLAGLRAAGFDVDFGEDGTGYLMKYLQRGGGYYMNVGCSELIAGGEIGLLRWADVDRFDADGVQLRDGGHRPFDTVVLATGYQNQDQMVAATLGPEVADRVGPIWGFDAEGELRNMWRATAQPGLWFLAGSLAQARIYSRYLAMQIAGLDAGLIAPARRDAVPRGTVRDVDLHPGLVG